MPQTNLEFVRALVTQELGLYVPARVVEANSALAVWWMKHVQPIIAQNATRPDRKWNWISIVERRHPLVWLAMVTGQKPRTYCIVTKSTNGDAIPIAMLLLVESYTFLPDNNHKAPFLWYLAGAPTAIFEQHIQGPRPKLLPAMIDIGVIVSYNKGHEGRLCLHSDPKGGESLVQKYLECGLKLVPEHVKLPLSREFFGRKRQGGTIIGRHLFAGPDEALLIRQRSDHLRQFPLDGNP